MNEQQLQEIEALCQKATPGPWAVGGTGDDAFTVWTDLHERPITRKVVECPVSGHYHFGETDDEKREANAAFIAATREAVPALIAALREERKRNAQLEAENSAFERELEADQRCMSGLEAQHEADAKQFVAALERVKALEGALVYVRALAILVGNKSWRQQSDALLDIRQKLAALSGSQPAVREMNAQAAYEASKHDPRPSFGFYVGRTKSSAQGKSDA